MTPFSSLGWLLPIVARSLTAHDKFSHDFKISSNCISVIRPKSNWYYTNCIFCICTIILQTGWHGSLQTVSHTSLHGSCPTMSLWPQPSLLDFLSFLLSSVPALQLSDYITQSASRHQKKPLHWLKHHYPTMHLGLALPFGLSAT